MVLDRGLFFFHNPKAGGSAIQSVVEACFAPSARAPLIENTQREHEQRAGDYADVKGYAFYGGHYGRDIFESVQTGHAAISNFRQPWARLLSLYNYYRLAVTLPDDAADLDNLYPVAVAQRADFHHFVSTDDPRIEIHTRNHHVRQLSASAWDVNSVGDLGAGCRTGRWDALVLFVRKPERVRSLGAAGIRPSLRTNSARQRHRRRQWAGSGGFGGQRHPQRHRA